MYQLLNHSLYVVKRFEEDKFPTIMSKPELQNVLQKNKQNANDLIVYKLLTQVGQRLDNKSLCSRKFLKEHGDWFDV